MVPSCVVYTIHDFEIGTVVLGTRGVSTVALVALGLSILGSLFHLSSIKSPLFTSAIMCTVQMMAEVRQCRRSTRLDRRSKPRFFGWGERTHEEFDPCTAIHHRGSTRSPGSALFRSVVASWHFGLVDFFQPTISLAIANFAAVVALTLKPPSSSLLSFHHIRALDRCVPVLLTGVTDAAKPVNTTSWSVSSELDPLFLPDALDNWR